MHFNAEKLVCAWKVFGVAPVRRRGGSLVYSRLVHYMSVLIIFLLNFTYLGAYYLADDDVTNQMLDASVTQDVVNIIDGCLVLSVPTFCVAYSGSTWRKFLTSLAAGREIDPALLALKVDRSDRFFPIAAVYSAGHVSLTVATVLFYFYNNESLLLFAFNYVLRLIPAFVVLQYVGVVSAVKIRFRVINESLVEIIKYNYKRRPIEVCTLPKLIGLSRIREKVCEISRQVDLAFGNQIFVCMTFITTRLTIVVYRIIIYTRFESSVVRNGSIAFNFLWITVLLAQLALILWTCSSTRKEAERGWLIILKWLTTRLPDSLYKQIMTCEFQFRFQKCVFTAGGYFNLDNSVFLAVLSSVSTYITILMTFQSKTQ